MSLTTNLRSMVSSYLLSESSLSYRLSGPASKAPPQVLSSFRRKRRSSEGVFSLPESTLDDHSLFLFEVTLCLPQGPYACEI